MNATPIRTPDQRLRIFVSSTLQELAEERQAVKEAVEHLRLTPVLFELGAAAHPPRELYRAYLEQSDVFVGVYWQRYGWVAPGETVSGLEDEYLLARPMPKLIYLKRADAREERLDGLIRTIQSDDKASYRPFRDAAELKQLVQDDLALMLTERFAASATVAPPGPPAAEAPVERGELIGREALGATLAGLLSQGDVGCVTLTGPGGIGKTRLAIHAANSLAARFPDGVFYVPLAPIRDAREVLPAIATALAQPPNPEREKQLVAFLRRRRALLVLDNFEQVLGAAGDLGRVLAACPNLKVLVTSREALRIQTEREVPIPPLAHDPAGQTVTPAMQLFEQRAREAVPGFGINDDNRATVAEICRRLDALPLALELAAARVRVLSPGAMLQRLDKSLTLLAGHRRDLPERQQTLRGAIDWSHELLTPDERVFFRRLGVFAGSFSEDAAVAVVGDAALEGLDGLTSLVEKSLLARVEVGGQVRFQMLGTVREFAGERLAQAGEGREVHSRHAAWVTALLAEAYTSMNTAAHRVGTVAQVAREEVDVRAALSFLSGPDGDLDQAWELFCHLAWLRYFEFRFDEVRLAYEAVKRKGSPTDPVVAATALGFAAWASFGSPSAATVADLEYSVRVLEAHGERRFLPGILTVYGMVLSALEPQRALPVLDRALALCAQTGTRGIESWSRLTRAIHLMMSGQLELSDRAAEELVAWASSHGEPEGVIFGMTTKGRLQVMRGELAAARVSFGDAAAHARSNGDSLYGRHDALQLLAGVMLAQSDGRAARAVLEELVGFFSKRSAVSSGELAWGALASLLARDGEEQRARAVLAVIPRGAEQVPPALKLQLDPTGALAKATGEVRALLGDPEPLAPELIDVEVALRAAVGAR